MEILGFPKKLAQFKFIVTVPSSSGDPDGSGTETFKISDPAFNATKLLEPGAIVAAEVYRGGTKLISFSGRLDKKQIDGGGRVGLFPQKRSVFVQIQTSHPLPPDDPDDPDQLCVGNRPRLLQVVFDEVPTENIWKLADPAISINGTQTDPIGSPFGMKLGDEGTPLTTASTKNNGLDGHPLEVIDASFGGAARVQQPQPCMLKTVTLLMCHNSSHLTSLLEMYLCERYNVPPAW